MDCNQLAVDIDNELVVVHNWVRLNAGVSPDAERKAASVVLIRWSMRSVVHAVVPAPFVDSLWAVYGAICTNTCCRQS